MRVGGKDYGWAFGIPGVVVVEIWYPSGAEGWTLPWSYCWERENETQE